MSKNIHHAGHTGKKQGFPLFRLALGAALAAGAGYYVTHKEEVDKEAKKSIDLLAKLFKEKRPVVEKRVKQIWGKVSTEGIATYMDLRGQLLHALEKENLKKRGKMLKVQYEKMVKDVIGKARKSGVLTPDVEAKLAEVFKMDWKQVSTVLMDLLVMGAKKTATVVRKAKKARKTMKRAVRAKAGGKKKPVRAAIKKTAKTAGKKSARSAKKSVRRVKRGRR